MKRLTYNNFLKAAKIVRAKGWTDDKEVDKIVRNAFELCAGNAYQMPVEWYLSMIVKPEEV